MFEAADLAPLLTRRDDVLAAVEAIVATASTAATLTPLVAALDHLTADAYTSAREFDAFGAALARDDVGHHALLTMHAMQGRVRGLLRRGRLGEADAALKVAVAAPAVRRATWLHATLRECEGGIHFMSWRIPEAIAALEDACALAHRHGDRLHAARIMWLCALALATRARLRESTVRLHEAAIECAHHGDLRSLARIESTLGAIALEEGRLDAARAHFDRAIAMALERSIARLVMTATGYRGVVELAAGDAAAALRFLDEALGMARAQGQTREPRVGIFLAASAAAVVDTHGFEPAVARPGAARMLVGDDATLVAVTALYGACVDLREAKRMLALADREGASTRWRAVLRGVEAIRSTEVALLPGTRSAPRLLDVSDDVRIALQIVERQLPAYSALFAPPGAPGDTPRGSAPRPTLTVAEGGAWFSLGGASVPLNERSLLRKLLWALCEHSVRRPTERVPVGVLIAAAWGDQRLGPKVAANRLYVAVSALRKLGLREVLKGDRAGYVLDARVEVAFR